ncbi:glycoside hydrolase/deacetylase [Piromyces finnis]|uniref:Glycoside hydrolase/deacetylase n=1 Tax=Piromyces finnis TaxID=1754191 RepID=A0A1Y1VCS2_9FUNG|nr:glycoside hydrolase/deacetylase [Piromyces finnis]|eukprot:ORX52880.1 glycoside hydrolase/deacetylase [Piromyces finnis]
MNSITFIILIITIFITYVETTIISSCTQNKTIALTFDDGPFKHTRELIEYIIKYHDVKVSFFVVGKFHYPYAVDDESYQYAMKKAHDFGYQIGSQTYTHEIPKDKKKFKESLTKNDDFIEKYTGDRPKYFRAPKENCDKECQSNIEEWGYKLIQWDVDTKDWDLNASGSVERRVQDSVNYLENVFSEERDSYLIRLHDTQNYTVHEIVPWIIEKSGMKEKGYRFVTVAECLGEKKNMYNSGKVYGDDMYVHQVPVVVNGNSTSNINIIDNQQNIKSEGVKNLNSLLSLKYLLSFIVLFFLLR